MSINTCGTLLFSMQWRFILYYIIHLAANKNTLFKILIFVVLKLVKILKDLSTWDPTQWTCDINYVKVPWQLFGILTS